MKHPLPLILLLLILIGCTSPTTPPLTIDSHFTIETIPTDFPDFLQDNFTQYVNVFSINIVGTPKTDPNKLLHAAGVMAQYLDNNEDGEPDNPAVVQAMRDNNATLVMFATQREVTRVMLLGGNLPDGWLLQDLYATETHPNGAENGRFDASLEEVLHIITHAGYAYAYPDVFGEEAGTLVAEAMDVARGGHFTTIPSPYPAGAWYTYDDTTCEYNCQITEYIYWALTSLLGGQNFPGRGEEIAHEWQLNTPAKLQEQDLLIYELLTNPTYHWPTQLPDGNYQPETNDN